MAYKEFPKNSRANVRIGPKIFEDYPIINIRVYVPNKEGEIVPGRQGIALNVDQIPDLIQCLEWALQQPCQEDEDTKPVPALSNEDANDLALYTYTVLAKYGRHAHWDMIEGMVLKSPKMHRFNKWQIHYILTTRRDLFQLTGAGCFKAIKHK